VPQGLPRQPHGHLHSGCRAPRLRANQHRARLASGDVPALAPCGGTAAPPAVAPEQSSSASEFIAFLQDLPWSRACVWAAAVLAAYQLKDFFGIAMGTFIISFIGNGFVQSTRNAPLLRNLSSTTRRRLLVVVYFIAIVSVLGLFGVLTAPDIIREGSDFVTRLKSDNVYVVVLEKMRHGLGDGVMDQVERLLSVASGDDLAAASAATAGEWTTARVAALGSVLQNLLRDSTEIAISVTSGLLTSITRFAVQTFAALILSIFVLWDLPNIRAGVTSLRSSRLAPIYDEVAPSLAVFGTLFGKALQAQTQIALANTALTAFGMYMMLIPGIGLLSLFVFICSFIPIAGVFMSTIPIAFVAVTEYGFMKLALVILMVLITHMVEAYALNPAIYSAHLKLHPLLVLSVLVIAEHSLGVWGLLLAVPLTVFLLDYCIRYPASSIKDVAANELETMTSVDRDFDPNSTLRKEDLKAELTGGLGSLG